MREGEGGLGTKDNQGCLGSLRHSDNSLPLVVPHIQRQPFPSASLPGSPAIPYANTWCQAPPRPSQARASTPCTSLTRLSSCLLLCCSTSSLSSNSCWSRFLVKSTSRTARSYFRRHSPPVAWGQTGDE